MFDLRKIAAAIVIFLGLVSAAKADETVLLEKCGEAAEGFVFMVDVSGSMMHNLGDVKKEAQDDYKKLAASGKLDPKELPVFPINAELDDLHLVSIAKNFIKDASSYALTHADMTAALYSAAPFTVMAKSSNYDKEEFLKILEQKLHDDLEIFGRPTWLGKRGLDYLSKPLASSQSMIIITDGYFDVESEGKQKPAEAIQAFLKSNPGSNIYLLSLAYTPEQKKAIDALKNLSDRVKCADLETLMSNEEKRLQFYAEAFYMDCSNVPVIEIHNVYFDFDKDTLRADSRAVLDKALAVIKARDPSEQITVVGWTDMIGSEAYNQDLSERRADTVKRYFEQNGISIERLNAIGKGESYKYDNATAEGRFHNRRVELHFNK